MPDFVRVISPDTEAELAAIVEMLEAHAVPCFVRDTRLVWVPSQSRDIALRDKVRQRIQQIYFQRKSDLALRGATSQHAVQLPPASNTASGSGPRPSEGVLVT